MKRTVPMSRRTAPALALALTLLASSPLPAADGEESTHDGIEFVTIPPGTFLMGTTDSQRVALIEQKAWTRFQEWERPAHLVTVSRPFLLSKCEITQTQWTRVMEKNPSAFPGGELPVDSVSWLDAQQFIQKLNAQSKATYRLPTEAEWEYACRAGSTNLVGLGQTGELPGELPSERETWHRGTAENTTHPVGQKQPNAWGLHDMHGNVWEWCQDWYASDYYHRSPARDPLNLEAGVERVLRGGSWFLDLAHARAASRSGQRPELRSQFVGFRLVREIP